MILLSNTTIFNFPFTDPILIFTLILFIILFAPLILNKLRIPHIIGLIIAGAIIGPNGFNLILRDSSFELFGTVGLLYIMFMAGLDMDLNDVKKNGKRSVAFGLFTFGIPMALGVFSGYYILGFSLLSSLLLGSMLSSHTLITYPIVSKLGVSKNSAVNVAVGGTIITDTLALLSLAVIAGSITGDISEDFWIRLAISLVVFTAIVIFLFPIIARWFFKHNNDNISQYIFVLCIVFLSALLADYSGLEGIIGAFFAGLALNRLIPSTSPLMNRIEFVGNALFIPFFLIGVGMLIDFDIFVGDITSLLVALTITGVAVFSKYLAALVTQKTFKFSSDQRGIIFGLSNSRAAATLAIVMVGHNLGLFNDDVLNESILMILITCTISSFVTQKAAKNIAKADLTELDDDNKDEEQILIPVNNPDMATRLVRLSMVLKNSQSKNNLYALNIINNENSENTEYEKRARKILATASDIAASNDNTLTQLLRYDIDLTNAIISVIKEHKITDLVLGLHQKKDISDTFLGMLTEGILSRVNITTFIYRAQQPLATVKRQLVMIPENADKEIGFSFWLTKVWNIGRNAKTKLVFYAPGRTIPFLKILEEKYPIDAEFNEFYNWENFLVLSEEIRPDDSLIFVMSRVNEPSYTRVMEEIPVYLNKFFKNNNCILIYPIQAVDDDESEFDRLNPSLDTGRLTNFTKKIQSILRK